MTDKTTVPLSRSLGRGTPGHHETNRDTSRDTAGTVSLKALAVKALGRDSQRDSGGTVPQITVPRPETAAGHFSPPARARADGPLDGADLLDRYHERAAICEFDGGEDRARAEGRAWNEAATTWYVAHGTPTPASLCAGCGKPLDSAEALDLWPHDERRHADINLKCDIPYRRRWKGAAAAALSAYGISVPVKIASELLSGEADDDHAA